MARVTSVVELQATHLVWLVFFRFFCLAILDSAPSCDADVSAAAKSCDVDVADVVWSVRRRTNADN